MLLYCNMCIGNDHYWIQTILLYTRHFYKIYKDMIVVLQYSADPVPMTASVFSIISFFKHISNKQANSRKLDKVLGTLIKFYTGQ